MKHKLSNSDRFTFGKYNGRLVSEIVIIDFNYIKWLFENKIIEPIGYLKQIL